MKLNRLDTHDRLKYFKEDQSINIFQGAEDCLKKNSLSLMLQDHSPYIYIFAHPRTDENLNKEMYWQARLTRPKAQTNSYLFRAQSKSDVIEVCWLIPPREQWNQYFMGNITESKEVMWSINEFRRHPETLEMPLPDDMSEERGRQIYSQIKEDLERKKNKPMLEI